LLCSRILWYFTIKGRNTNEYAIYGIQIHGPKRKFVTPARPYPAVQSGGMSAVAIATPGIGLPFSTLVMAITNQSAKKGNKNIVNIR
jgi:hypothetical protein